jgi:hypothetical protein
MKTWRMIVLFFALIVAVPFQAALAQVVPVPNLGTAGNFAVLAGTAVTCTGAIITGDVGVDTGGSIGACTVIGNTYVGGIAATAYDDFLVAYAALSPMPGEVHTVQNGTLAGLTLTPGVYWIDDSAKTGVLTLDGLGNPNAVWIFKSGTSGTGALAGNSFNVVMAGGGDPCANGARVFWWSAQAATLTDSNFIGTVLAGTDFTLTNGNFRGQALAKGAVTLTTPGIFTFCGNGSGCTPPGEFNLLTPANGALDVPLTGVTLDWTDSVGAATYTLYFGTTNPPASYHIGLTASQYALPFLNADTTYYWSVTATNGCLPDVSTGVWSFQTGVPCIPPDVPHLKSPPNGATNVLPPVTLSWYAAANATFYEVWLGLQSGHLKLIGTTTDLFWVVPDLLEATTYYWLISAVNDCGFAHSATWSFTTAGGQPEPLQTLLFIPGAASIPGDQSSQWKTDVHVMNISDQDAAFSVTFIPADTDGTQSTHVISGILGAGQVQQYVDIVHDAFGLSEAFGGLRIAGDQILIAIARTYDDTENGTYGQFIMGHRVDPVLGLPDIRNLLSHGEVGYLIHLISEVAFRSNVGFMEVTGKAATVEVALFSDLNAPLGTKTYTLLPLGFHQVNDIFEDMGVTGDHLSARAEVRVTGEGTVLAYASIIDSKTNDAIFTVVQKLLGTSSEVVQTLAAAANTHGAYNTFWHSDVRVLNPSADSLNITYTYRPVGLAAITMTLAVPSMNILYAGNALSQLFGITYDTYGSMEVSAGAPLVVSSRIYTPSVDGTYGQQIPSNRSDQGIIVAEAKQIILGLHRNEDYRTNLGLTEIAGGGLTVLVQLYDTTGAFIAERTVALAPYQHLQWNDVFLQWGLNGPFEAYAVVQGMVGGGRAVAYASVVDNRTGDAIYIPAQ